MNEDELLALIQRLEERLGRLPSIEEIESFINGDEETRLQIWNQNSN